jgi:hypothetical protein
MLFDLNAQKWTELARIPIAYAEWSHNGDYIYFMRTAPTNERGIFRIRISDHKLEQVASLKDFRQAPDFGFWTGVAPDDSPLLVRDAGTQDIYALDWQAP